MYDEALNYLKQTLGGEAYFRDGQWEAIELAMNNNRILIVQKTGWGKSIVYFITTKMLRKRNKGPAILISPLLSLVRNQIDSATALGIEAGSINSQNFDEWDEIKHKLKTDTLDILLISPEQLANRDRFMELLSLTPKGIGLFVVDEAHCISDWGHDFRPDYRRISNIIKSLPPNVPVIATTATANQRVVEDICSQLGNISLSRGPLVRESLRLQAIRLKDQAERMAWLAENIPKMSGVGIVYCLTVGDCDKVARFLQTKSIDARAYNGRLESEERKSLEILFMKNGVKCLVATVALGMGYDKKDIGFVIHYQRPGNVVSYYQQIGRAGRNLEMAYAILLNGIEDDEIQEYFIETAFPTQVEMTDVIRVLEQSSDGLTLHQILKLVNMRMSRLEKCLKYLEVESTVSKAKDGSYFRTVSDWAPDRDRSEKVTKRRYEELEEMRDFVNLDECYMRFIARKLDDPYARECNKCANCTGSKFFPTSVGHETVLSAISFLKDEVISIEQRKIWPAGVMGDLQKKIPEQFKVETGRALCMYGDAGWGRFMHEDKYINRVIREEIVDASVSLILQWLRDRMERLRIAYIPSLNRPKLVKSFAHRLGDKLGIPCLDIIKKVKDTRQQKELENSVFQCKNALDGFSVIQECGDFDILLIDDMVDSRWTLTVCGYLLKQKGAGLVFPFAIASTAGMRQLD